MVRCSVVNVKAMKCHGQVNARRVAAILFVLQEVLFLGFPFPFNILQIFSSVASLLVGVLTLLCKEKIPPDVIPGKSSGGKHLKFILKVNPPDVQIVPKVLGTFSLKGFSTHRDKRGMPSG